jgi:hypothetical protein
MHSSSEAQIFAPLVRVGARLLGRFVHCVCAARMRCDSVPTKPLRCAIALPLAAVLAGLASSCTRAPADPQRVLVFGIDGGTWDVMLDMFRAGELPTLKRLYDSGVHGVLESRPPILSPVVWSTIFTGRPWQEHGVKDWKTSQSQHRKVKALWQITSGLGLEAEIVNAPSTWPPEQIRGSMVSGFPLSGSTIGGNTGEIVDADVTLRPGAPRAYERSADDIRPHLAGLEVGQWSDWFSVRGHPPSRWQGTMRVLRFEPDRYYLTPIYATSDAITITSPSSLREEIAAEIGRAYVPEGPGWSRYADEDTPKVLHDHLLQVAQIQTDAAAWLVKRKWDLFVYVDTLVDRVSHPYWAYMHPDDYDGVDPAKAARCADAAKTWEQLRGLGYVEGTPPARPGAAPAAPAHDADPPS